MAGVHACVSRGLSVIQGDADTDLRDYHDQAFDYVGLSQTLQAMRARTSVLADLGRLGQRAIVRCSNLGYRGVRLALLIEGRMPVTRPLSRVLWETANRHFCTLSGVVVA